MPALSEEDHQELHYRGCGQREGSDTQFLICECGERITYWQITAQLRSQKTAGTKIQAWFQGLFKPHGWPGMKRVKSRTGNHRSEWS